MVKFALLKDKNVLGLGGFAPLTRGLSLDPTGGSAPDPHYRLALAMSPSPPTFMMKFTPMCPLETKDIFLLKQKPK